MICCNAWQYKQARQVVLDNSKGDKKAVDCFDKHLAAIVSIIDSVWYCREVVRLAETIEDMYAVIALVNSKIKAKYCRQFKEE